MGARILLVEKDVPRRQSHAAVLAALPESAVVVAADSREALLQAAEQSFDLVVADLVLPKPGLSGADALLRVGELCPDAKTVLFTDHGYTAALLEDTGDAFLATAGDPDLFPAELAKTAVRLLGRPADQDAADQDAAGLRREATLLARPQGAQEEKEPPRLVAGKYRIGRELGRGGMGVVYEAEDTFIARPVAVKLLHLRAVAAARKKVEQRMRREVMIAGRLDHPHIVTVYDAGLEGDEIFLVMELVDGQSLYELLRDRGRLERAEAIAFLLQILDAVGYAHEKGIVHRDLKHENVILTTDGKVKVVDFGLAKVLAFASSASFKAPRQVLSHTTEGAVLGTMAYMAPEQILGRPVDQRADVYSLGVMLFEMVDGRSLMSLVTPLTRAAAFSTDGAEIEIPAIKDDPQLTRIVRRALAARPEERFPDTEAFASALKKLDDHGWRRFLPWNRK